jgi:hypothetical protein
MGAPAEKAALLQRRDQTMDARFRLQPQRLLHFLEGGGEAGLTQVPVYEYQQLVLLPREHGSSSYPGGYAPAPDWRTNGQPTRMF